MDDGRPTLWTELEQTKQTLRELELHVKTLEALVDSLRGQVQTLTRVGVMLLAGLLGVAVTIALAVHK